MDKLDGLVVDHLVDRPFRPDRLTALLASVMNRRIQKSAEAHARVATLQTQASEAEEKLKRLYRMVEEGVTDLDEILKNRVATLKAERDNAKAALDRILDRSASAMSFDPEAIERFGRLMRQNVTTGEAPFRKSYIRSVVDRVEVDDGVIRIIGDKATLEQTVATGAAGAPRVRIFVPKWRARKDSNL